ncbi:hypothetical protein [Vallitalea maricola]|uniref:Uncharacterized protein n=1 Tax=Vallitalea maricola TaxID=3074433 RepID=A0ACB5UG13_9FIRM|nr:hypothetical protein AN2V17_09100 [Vallitalea sp. AN17-2]
MHEISINNEELSKKESQFKNKALKINCIKDNLSNITNSLDSDIKYSQNINLDLKRLYNDLDKIELQLYATGNFIRDTYKSYTEIERKLKLAFAKLDNVRINKNSSKSSLPLTDKNEESFLTRIGNKLISGLKHLHDFFTDSNEKVNNKPIPKDNDDINFTTVNNFINYNPYMFYAYDTRLYLQSKENWPTWNTSDKSKNNNTDYDTNDSWSYNGSYVLPLAIGFDNAVFNGTIRKGTNWIKKQLGMDNIYEDEATQYLVNHDTMFGSYYAAGEILGIIPLFGSQRFSPSPSFATTTGEVIPTAIPTEISIPGIVFSDSNQEKNELDDTKEINKTTQIAKSSPIKIPNTSKIIVQNKTGYQQIKYKWSDGIIKYEARWHTRTPGAPENQGNTWVITRTTPGTATGQRKTQHILTGDNQWTPMSEWQSAVNARQNCIATPEQQILLDHGHWPAP